MGAMDSGEPHVLYRLRDGKGLLYVGVSNEWTRRMREHSRDKEWFRDVARVELESYPSRESVLRAEERAIKHEHPLYNVIHNVGAEVLAEIRPEDVVRGLAGGAALLCAAILAARWLLDAGSAWWQRHRAQREGGEVRVLPIRNPFTEEPQSLTAQFMYGCLMVAALDRGAVRKPLAEPATLGGIAAPGSRPALPGTSKPGGAETALA